MRVLLSLLTGTLLLVPSALLAIYVYSVYYLGQPSVHAGLLLVWRGCLKYKAVDWRALTALGVTLAARDGPAIFKADLVTLESLGLSKIAVRIFKPHLNFLTDPDGLLHMVALLQDVGYLEEAKADPSRRKALLSGPAGECSKTAVLRPRGASFKGEAHVLNAHVILEEGTMELPPDVGQIIGEKVDVTLLVGTANVERGTPKNEEAWWQRSSQETSTSYDRIRYPILLLLKSENIHTTLKGWRTDRGFLLQKPVETVLHFTPDLAVFTLSKLHPLLGYAVDLEGTDYIKSTLEPAQMHLPSEMMSLRLEPLRVKLKTKAFVSTLAAFLKFAGRDWDEPNTMHAWTSAISADVYRSGIIVSKRMDILLGHNVHAGKGIHICMWGTVDTSKNNKVEMKMGLPASTLRRMGAKEIEDDFVYQMDVGGTAQAPEVNFLRAGKDLTEIVLKSNMQEGFPFLKKVMRNPSEKRRKKQAADIPPPSLPYPWQAFSVSESEN